MSRNLSSRLHRLLLVLVFLLNFFLFLTGMVSALVREDHLLLSLIVCLVGLFGMLLFTLFCILHPQFERRRRREKRREVEEERLNPVCAESLMRNIRGIPFLIQAIQYSMEATQYRDLMTEMGEGVVRTSVIHTAPACTSILDSESDEEERSMLRATPRNSGASEQWLPLGERWRNEQLRLSLEQPSHPTTLLVFPFRESTPQTDGSLSGSTLELNTYGKKEDKRKAVRCIGMSAAFLSQLGAGIGKIEMEEP